MTDVELPDVLRKIRLNHHLFWILLAWAHDDFGSILGISDFEIVLKISILDTTRLFWIKLERHVCYDVERRKVMYVGRWLSGMGIISCGQARVNQKIHYLSDG